MNDSTTVGGMEKKSGWVNVYRDVVSKDLECGWQIFKTAKDAAREVAPSDGKSIYKHVAVARIEWEEVTQ